LKSGKNREDVRMEKTTDEKKADLFCLVNSILNRVNNNRKMLKKEPYVITDMEIMWAVENYIMQHPQDDVVFR
jgi:hypothetical protein